MKNIDSFATASPSSNGFICLEVSSIALGYRVLQIFSAASDVRVLEASPVGSKFLIFAEGSSASLEATFQSVKAEADASSADLWSDTELIAHSVPEIIDAIFSLSQTPLEETLVVIECETVSACLAALHTLVSGHGLKAIDFRIQRSSTGGAYAFATGSSSVCGPAAEDVRTKLRERMRKVRIEIIDRPNANFRSFFEITG